MDFLSTMKAKAKADKKVIVLPESYEKRNLEAAAECLKEELADIVLIGKKDKIMEAAGSFDVSKAIFVDPETYDRMDEMVAGLAEARKSKGMTLEEARKMREEAEAIRAKAEKELADARKQQGQSDSGDDQTKEEGTES